MEQIIAYLKSFLTYGDTEAAKRIGYTADKDTWKSYKVVILPNGHLGKDWVLPTMANVQACLQEGVYVIEEDILYTTLFFISRAEELLVPDRDEHGRFAAKYSILGSNNRLQIPLLDEYARSVMKLLDLPLPKQQFNHIFLTHDIDTIAYYRHLRGFVGGWLRDGMDAVLDAVEDIHSDPAYTFPWLVEQDAKVKNAEVIYFVKDTPGKGYDYPQYKLHGKDFRRLKNYLEAHHAKLGLHSSYYEPKEKYQSSIINCQLNRSHFLRCSIDQMQRLANAGVTDDFTMSFPDAAGFRLQTTRAVRWINPVTYQLSTLNLHPLTVMDNTLSAGKYMGLTEDEAYFYCQRLFDKIRQNNGDLCLLWHNTSINNTEYHKSLYPKLLTLI